jgi:hypothetical protein
MRNLEKENISVSQLVSSHSGTMTVLMVDTGSRDKEPYERGLKGLYLPFIKLPYY